MRAKIDLNQRAFHTVWIRAGLSDSTCCYVSLASATIFFEQGSEHLDVGYIRNRQAELYYCKALSSLNARMSDTNSLHNAGVITSILGFLCHDVGTATLLGGQAYS